MDLLISFSEYYELSEYLKSDGCSSVGEIRLPKKKWIKPNLSALKVKAMYLASPMPSAMLGKLVTACSREMLLELMEHCNEDAEFQRLLNQRLDELDKEDSKSLESVMEESQNRKDSIYDLLIEEMEKRGYKKDSDFYTYIGMDRRAFAKLRKENATVSRETALWLAAGLELDFYDGSEFLGELGYTFRKTDNREIIITHIMRTRKYKFNDMQFALYSLGLKVLGESIEK